MLLIIIGLSVIGIVIGEFVIAPEGYEDDLGFHLFFPDDIVVG